MIIQVDDRAVVADLRGYHGKVTKAAVNALNKAIKTGESAMVRDIAADTGLQAKAVRKSMSLSKANYERLSAAFGGKLKRVPLVYFGPARGPEPSRGKGRGVSYKLLGQGRSRAPHAFIATMKSGHRGVFTRHPSGARMKSDKQKQLIVELFGPSVGHVFKKFQAKGATVTSEAFTRYFDHEVKRLTVAQDVTPDA